MIGRSALRMVPVAAVLLSLPLAGCAREAAAPPVPPVPSIQAVVDSVSQAHYETYHSDIENMGLGLYGGAEYDMGFRSRDAHDGLGSLGNQEARLYLQEAFTSMGLSVSVQGEHLNVVGELTGTTTPENIFIIGAHYDHLEGDRPGGMTTPRARPACWRPPGS